MTFIFRNGAIFGTSQNGIEDKQSGTEGVFQYYFSGFPPLRWNLVGFKPVEFLTFNWE